MPKFAKKPLSADDQEKLADLVASWISFDPADKPEKLTTLDYHNSRYEMIVTKSVISRHEALLTAIFDSNVYSPGPPGRH